jgi:mannose-6-phosphate isomerase-like protein (cupin superfamily)
MTMDEGARRPSRVGRDHVRMRSVAANDGFRIGTLIDATSHDSPLLLGLAWIEPGTDPVWWSANDETHEAYYVLAGRLKVMWEGDDPGESVLEPEDSFYFPPGRRYGVENAGAAQGFIVWALTPSVRS